MDTSEPTIVLDLIDGVGDKVRCTCTRNGVKTYWFDLGFAHYEEWHNIQKISNPVWVNMLPLLFAARKELEREPE